MSDIYQQIWDTDVRDWHGVQAISKSDADAGAQLPDEGYVIVDEKIQHLGNSDLIIAVNIPDAKQDSYKLIERLFNNYTLDQTKPEHNFPEEEQEVSDYLDLVQDCPPMKVAREYVNAQIATQASSGAIQPLSVAEWRAIIRRAWFEQFDLGHNLNLSGFEHVFVGEQKQGTVQGYHFWYKYFLDEHFRVPAAANNNQPEQDLLKVLQQSLNQSIDVVTLKFQYRAFDFDAKEFRPLTKPLGGFFVGPSAAGLMAMGLVRFLPNALSPKQADIHGYHYNLQMFRSADDRNMRTFYPEFVGVSH